MTPFTKPECEIITKAERLSEVAAILCRQSELAVDLEMDSLHHYQEKVCLIQVSTRTESWLIDPLAFVILVLSLVGCFAGTLLTPAEDDAVLESFYRQVRPWGFWGPILAKVLQDDPGFERNKDFKRDMFNIVVGIAWQTALVVLPICFVIRKWNGALIAVAVVALTSLILKFTWYDNLDKREAFHANDPQHGGAV